METLKILTQKKLTFDNWEVDKYTILPPIPISNIWRYGGSDPGTVNLGISWLYTTDDGKDRADLWQIRLERITDSVERIIFFNNLLYDLIPNILGGVRNMIIENAAYAKGFRQVELAEQRAIMAVWYRKEAGFRVRMVPPLSIRKVVFGSGKVKAHEAWQLDGIPKNKQPNDALAALACAYYGMMKEEE